MFILVFGFRKEKKKTLCTFLRKHNLTYISKENFFSFVLLIAGTDCFVPGFRSLFCY